MDPNGFVFRFAEFEVSEQALRLTRAGEDLALEPKALRVLLYLLRHPGRVVTKDELLNAIWGNTAVTENSLTRAVALLRKALEDDIREPRFIATIPTSGYRFIAPIEAKPSSAEATDIETALGRGAGELPEIKSNTSAASSWKWSWRSGLAMAVVVVIAVTLGMIYARRGSDSPPTQLRATIPPPPGEGFWANLTLPAAVSPDGQYLAIISMRDAQRHLWLRRLDGSEAQLIAGTEDATNPFWSPDSRSVGFFAGGKLKRLEVAGGAVNDVCQAGLFTMGGSWSTQGVILFANLDNALRRVPAKGGTPEPISGLTLSNEAIGQSWPEFLPDGKHFIYLEWRYAGYGSDQNGVWIGSLDGQAPRRLPLTGTNVRYASGYLLFSQAGNLYAQKFDASRIQLTETPRLVARKIQFDTFFDNAGFSVSENGILIYAPSGTGVNSVLTWVNREGTPLGQLGGAEQFIGQAISPDGTHVAVGTKPSDSREKIWIYDVERSTRIPLVTDETGPSAHALISGPRWSPDAKEVAYRYMAGRRSAVAVHAADASGQERKIAERTEDLFAVEDWSPDAQSILTTVIRFAGPQDWHTQLLVVAAGKDPNNFVIDDASDGKFSPDGHWVAFDDVASGQVYITSFPQPGPRIALSSTGGQYPRWRGDGQEIFYISNDRNVVSVQVRESPAEFHVLSSRPLFHLSLPDDAQFYDVTREGQRFLVNIRTAREQDAPLTLVTNWTASQ